MLVKSCLTARNLKGRQNETMQTVWGSLEDCFIHTSICYSNWRRAQNKEESHGAVEVPSWRRLVCTDTYRVHQCLSVCHI